MRRVHVSHLVLVAIVIAAGHSLDAQEPNGAARPRVFFDCQGPQCDLTYYRTEIVWVDWVRDAQDSNVHVIMTSQTTGAGGREYILDFIGRGPADGYAAQSRYRANATDTQREELDAIAYTLALALAQFGNSEGFGGMLQIEPLNGGLVGGVPDRVLTAAEVDDPWNLWTFRLNGSGNFSGEETRTSIQLNTGLNASRVTPTWKTSFQGSWNLNRQEIDRTDGSVLVDERINWSLNTTVVYSLAEHWSIGFTGGPGRMTNRNQRLRMQINPAIEYSVFPYEEATRRAFTFFYEIGPVYRDYFEETIHGKNDEVLLEQAFRVGFSQRQPWGNASINAVASSYIPKTHRYNLSLNGNLSYRLTRGLDLNLNGNVSSVRDQIYLSGRGLTEEERLLRIRQEATDYTYGGSVGISYQFGSIFNNVVNNRF
ncbi:MAG: hypothetical protein WEG36_08310 [Gemmatimonadota bacterium]